MHLSQEQQQRQMLSQQMKLSVRILQMDNLQLADYLKELALENPVIELEPSGDTRPKDSREELFVRKLEWLDSQTKRVKENIGYYGEDEVERENIAGVHDEISLTDHLLQQVELCDCAPRLLPVVRFVIGNLDDNGYIMEDLEQLAVQFGYSQTQLRQAIHVVQGLDPAGVGARSLSECLLLQLPEEQALARRLVSEHLQLVAQNQFAKLAKQTQAPVETIRDATNQIRRLNPKPGSVFRGNDTVQYIMPDVVVTSFEKQYNVMLCEFGYPDIQLSAGYLQMAKETDDREVISYIQGKVAQFNWVKKCIQSRNETLSRVAKAIVEKQERFFRYGPQHLGIMRMKDIAQMLNLHESTVSRAVRNKYLQCAHGVYPLRHFFVQGIEGPDGGQGHSAHSIKEKIRAMVAGEDPAKPLSDQKIAQLLAEDGIEISRRTVAKYREALNIAGSFARAVR